jgi:hypothetical protein
MVINSYLFNPLGAPPGGFKRFGEVLGFMRYFPVFKFHDAYGVERAALVGNRIFRNPEVAGSEKPPDGKIPRMPRVMAAKILQIPFAGDPFTGLRVIADNLLVINFVLGILISGRRSSPMPSQSGFDLTGCLALLVLLFGLRHFGVLSLSRFRCWQPPCQPELGPAAIDTSPVRPCLNAKNQKNFPG